MVHLDADLTDPDGYNKVPLEHSLGVNRNVCPHSVPYPGRDGYPYLLLIPLHAFPPTTATDQPLTSSNTSSR